MLKKRALPTVDTAVVVGGAVVMLSSLAPLFPRPPPDEDDAEADDDADLGRGVGGLVEVDDLTESPVPVLLLIGIESPVPLLLLIGTADLIDSLVPLLLLIGDLIDSLVPLLILFPSPLLLKLLLLSNATSIAAAPVTIAGGGITLPPLPVATEFIAGEGDLMGEADLIGADDLIGEDDLIGAGEDDLIGLAILVLVLVVVGRSPLPFERDPTFFGLVTTGVAVPLNTSSKLAPPPTCCCCAIPPPRLTLGGG
mmetsp:Transcript_2626/g.4267  ORF Transcript_2626/g.4267 Transcript_2626/m.4267 type:complete len:253 (-) Transcript_2626:25-783(-)